MFFWFNNR